MDGYRRSLPKRYLQECEGKHRFRSWHECRRAVRPSARKDRSVRRLGAKLEPYRCDFCGYYHLGGNTSRSRNTLRRRETEERYRERMREDEEGETDADGDEGAETVAAPGSGRRGPEADDGGDLKGAGRAGARGADAACGGAGGV